MRIGMLLESRLQLTGKHHFRLENDFQNVANNKKIETLGTSTNTAHQTMKK